MAPRVRSASCPSSIPTTNPGNILAPRRQRRFWRDLPDRRAACLVVPGNTSWGCADLYRDGGSESFTEAHASIRLTGRIHPHNRLTVSTAGLVEEPVEVTVSHCHADIGRRNKGGEQHGPCNNGRRHNGPFARSRQIGHPPILTLDQRDQRRERRRPGDAVHLIGSCRTGDTDLHIRDIKEIIVPTTCFRGLGTPASSEN